MKKVILNGIALTGKEIYGVQRYATEILFALDKIIEPGVMEVVIPEKGERELELKRIKTVKVPVDVSKQRVVRLWNWFGFSRYVRKKNGISMDLTLTLPVGKCDIVAIHDCIIERCKQNSNTLKKKAGRLLYIFKVFLNVKRAHVVVTVSEYSRRDISRLYHIPLKKITILPNSWQHFDRIEVSEKVLQRYGVIEGEYFFALGSRLYHKNFRWIAEAARQNPKYKFIVSGSNNLGTSDTALDHTTENLIYAGYLSDEDVKALMMHCKAFIQPSLYEGFGIPPMEAMSTGARCIVSYRTSLPEIYRNSVWYIEPTDYNGIDMDRIMSERIANNNEVLDRFSWDKTAKKMLRVIYSLAKE